LESAQRSAVVNVLAEAFEYDPMQAWLFPNPRRRLQRLRRFYERDLAVRLEGTATVCLLGARAVAFWQPPAGCETLSIHSAIRLAPCFVSVAAHHPFAAMNVLGAVRGLGRMLLQWGIERADEEGVGTYLETANPDNLPFYRAAGYSQVGLVRVDDAPNVWTLWRGPTDMNSPAPPRQPADGAEVRTSAERDRSREDAT
jgi:GNAT superfamily N-acetyltransferase